MHHFVGFSIFNLWPFGLWLAPIRAIETALSVFNFVQNVKNLIWQSKLTCKDDVWAFCRGLSSQGWSPWNGGLERNKRRTAKHKSTSAASLAAALLGYFCFECINLPTPVICLGMLLFPSERVALCRECIISYAGCNYYIIFSLLRRDAGSSTCSETVNCRCEAIIIFISTKYYMNLSREIRWQYEFLE